MKRIVIIGASAYNNNNRGCNALLYGALSVLVNKYSIDEVVVLGSGTPAATIFQELNIDGKTAKIINELCHRNDFYNAFVDLIYFKLFKKTNNKFIKIINNSDVIFNINWGDGFTDMYGTKRLLRTFIENYVVSSLKKKHVFLPQTIGPFKTILGKMVARFALKNASQIFVRDNEANSYLDKLGVKYEKEFDLSVYMQPQPVDMVLPDNYIAINISSLLFCKTDLVDSSGFELYPVLIKKLIASFLEKGENIVFIPHTYNITEDRMEEDAFAINEIVKEFNSDKIFVVDRNYSAPQLKYIISKSKFFIGSRMHSCFAGLSTSTPTIGLGYSYKFKGGFEMFGVPECAISLKNLKEEQVESVITKIIGLYQDREKIYDTLFNTNKERKYIEL